MILKHKRLLKAIDSLCHAKVCKFFHFPVSFYIQFVLPFNDTLQK